MSNWEQPHWSGRPQEKHDARPRLRPNGFARLARYSLRNAGVVVAAALFLAALAAGLAILSIRLHPASAPAISLDPQTAAAQARLDANFPGIDKTIFGEIENANPQYARAGAVALAAELRRHGKLFSAVFVPGTGDFYDRNGLLYLSPPEVAGRVTAVLQKQPLYHALGASPNLLGLAALAREIANAVGEGRSPPALAEVLLAVSATVEGEAKGEPHPIDWTLLAGIKAQPDSTRWFIIASPQTGHEAEAAEAASVVGSRIAGLRWSFPPHTFDGTPARLSHDLLIPALLAILVVTIILGAGLGSFLQMVAVAAVAAVTLAMAAGIAVFAGPVFDAVTWSLAAAVIAPAMLFALLFVIAFGTARAAGKSTTTAIMIAGHRSGPSIVVYAAIAEALWLVWLPRQIDSLAVMAVSVGAGIAIAAVTALTLVPAILGLGWRDNEAGNHHWFDVAVSAPAGNNLRNVRALLALVLVAAAVFCTIFVPNVKFGDPQSGAFRNDALDNPGAIGAVHLIVKPQDTAAMIKKIGEVPQVGAIRWIEQFMPVDVEPKLNSLRSLADFLPGLVPQQPPDQSTITPELFQGLAESLRTIAASPAAEDSLREAAHRLGLALDLFAGQQLPTAAQVAALENAVFSGLGSLAAEADRLAVLRPPALTDLDSDLLRHYVAPDGSWRLEVLPKAQVSSLSFAAAMRRTSPEAAGLPVVALARNEIMHHESILALAPALAIASLLAVAIARRPGPMLVALIPTPIAMTLSAAGLVGSGALVDAAALAAIATSLALSYAAAITIATGSGGPGRIDGALRQALLPLAAMLAAVAPLAMSGNQAIAEFAMVASLFLGTSLISNALVASQLAYWLKETDERV